MKQRKSEIQLAIPESFITKAMASLDFIAQTSKTSIIVSFDETCDISYGQNPPLDSSIKFIFFNPKYYDPEQSFELLKDKWLPKGEGISRFDVIGAIFRLLFLLDEKKIKGVAFKKGFTSFLTNTLPKERQKFVEIPLCDLYVDNFFGKADSSSNGKKKLRVCLTHDVDGPEISTRWEILKSLTKFVLRKEKKFIWSAFKGFHCMLTGERGPFWQFKSWLEKEKLLGGKSAFFFFPGKEVYQKHINDPPYQINHHKKWEVLHEINENGGEVCFHPGIHYKKSGVSFQNAKEKFNALGIDVQGVRHHYWELNWNNPFETFEFQVQSGFHYDLSIAWKDTPGFRMSTCRPFKSWMPKRPDLNHVVIPTAIMDGHLLEYAAMNRDAQINKIKEIAAVVAKRKGVLVLDWHERVFKETPMYPNYGSLYFTALSLLCDEYNVEFLLPGEIYRQTISDYKIHRLLYKINLA